MKRAVGDVLRELRKTAGLTTREVAAQVGCSQAAISQWEAGNRTLSVPRLYDLAAAYGTTATQVLALIDERRDRS